MENHVPEVPLRNRRRGQHNPGPEEPQQHRGGRQGIFIQLHGPPDSQLLPGPGQEVQQGGAVHGPAPGPEAAEEILIARELPRQQDQRPAQPEQGKRLLPIRHPDSGGPRHRLGGGGDLRRGGRRSGFQGGRIRPVRLHEGNGGRDLLRLEQHPHGAVPQREGQQQPEHGDEPDVILPAFAGPLPPKGPEDQQDQDRQGPGEGQGGGGLQNLPHASPPPFSQKRLSSS